MKKALLLVVLLVILLPAGLVLADIAFENTKVTTHTFPGPIDEIVVRSGGGDVELVPARGRGVEVRETRHYVLKEPTLERDVDNGVLTLEVHCRASFVTCFSDLRMSVPAGTKLTLDTGSGDLEARGIDVHEARVQSDSGDMRLELAGRQRLVRAHADSGDVRIVVPSGEYAIATQTDSGDVNVDGISRNERAARSIEARTDSGDVTLNGK